MKKLVSLFITASMIVASITSVSAANVSYMADFESNEAKYRSGQNVGTNYDGTKNSAGDYKDFVTMGEAQGVDGSTGIQIAYSSATYYAGEIFRSLPLSWYDGADVAGVGAKFLNFDYKGKGVINLSFSTQVINDYSASNDGIKYTYKFAANTNGEWQKISIPFSDFKHGENSLENLEGINLFTFMAGENGGLDNNAASTKEMTKEELEARAKIGSVIFDNMELSDVGEHLYDPTTRVIDFDTYTLTHKNTWGGFANNDGTYRDFMQYLSADGKEGKGAHITYRAATYYSGEIFTATPELWAVNKDSNYLEFDAKGRAVLNINLETGNAENGKRYGQRVIIDTNGEWQRISMPLTKFLNSDESVPLSEVVGISFTNGENGGLSNSAEESKNMNASELEERAKTGDVVIDNLTLSEESSVTSFVADFERMDTKFGSGDKYSGHSAAGYSDFVTHEVVENEGVGGSTGYRISYSSAFLYAGEVFVQTPQIWDNGTESKYFNFDYNGRGAVKISFSTGNKNGVAVTGGTKYTRTFQLDSHGGWAKMSVPVSEFVNNGTSVNLEEIGAVTFQAAETAGIDRNTVDEQTMTANVLDELAKKGSIIFDNMELSATEGETTLFPKATVTAQIDGEEISELANGDITVKAAVSGLKNNTKVTVVAAIYNEDGSLDDVKLAANTLINGTGDITLDIKAADTESGKTMKVLVFDDFDNLHPMVGATPF